MSLSAHVQTVGRCVSVIIASIAISGEKVLAPTVLACAWETSVGNVMKGDHMFARNVGARALAVNVCSVMSARHIHVQSAAGLALEVNARHVTLQKHIDVLIVESHVLVASAVNVIYNSQQPHPCPKCGKLCVGRQCRDCHLRRFG